MTAKTLLENLGTIAQANAYLDATRRVPFEALEAIMNLHILETPGLESLRRSFEVRQWHLLMSQCRSAAAGRIPTFIEGVGNDRYASDEIRKEALRILILQKLALVAAEFNLDEPEFGN